MHSTKDGRYIVTITDQKHKKKIKNRKIRAAI